MAHRGSSSDDEFDDEDDEKDEAAGSPWDTREGRALTPAAAREQLRTAFRVGGTAEDYEEALECVDADELALLVVRTLTALRKYRDGDPPPWTTLFELREISRALIEYAAESPANAPAQLHDPRMTVTEVSLRVALYVLRHGLVTSDVCVALTGREVTRQRRPTFDVAGFLAGHGCQYTGAPRGVQASYEVKGAAHQLLLDRDRQRGSVVADVAPGSRLIVHAEPGMTQNTKSSLEADSLRRGIGVALTRYETTWQDLLVVAVPRSTRMRELIAAARRSARIAASGLSLAMVNSAGEVEGLPMLAEYVPPGLDDFGEIR